MKSLRFLIPLTLSVPAFGQGVVNPGTISASVTIANAAGAVRTRLTTAGGPQLRNHYVQARTTEPTPGVASAIAAPSGSTASTLAFTVDSSGAPSWIVSQRLDFEVYGEQLYWPESVPLPMAVNGTITPDVTEKVSIVDFTFGQAIAGGRIRVYGAGSGETLAESASLPAGITHCEFVVPTGQPLIIDLGIDIGSGGPLGTQRRVARRVTTWSAGAGVPVDQIFSVPISLTAGGTGAITGTFDIVGEEEISVTSPAPGIGGYTGVTANYYSALGATWSRRTVIAGSPSSGAFTLGNLTTSAGIAANDPGSAYNMQAEAWLRRTMAGGQRSLQFFRSGEYSPAPPITVPSSVGSVFEIQPGLVRGTYTLQGPPSVAGQPPLLAHINSAATGDTNDDGIPDIPGLLNNPEAWLDRAAVTMRGYNAPTNPAATQAVASQLLEHTWAEPNVTAPWELSLGGLSSASSEWRAPELRLLMQSGDISSADRYFNTDYTMSAVGAPNSTITPASTETRNYTAPMGELCLTVRSAGGGVLLYQPEIRWYEGGLIPGPANAWNVAGIRAHGFPVSAATATATATLRTLLPAGTYTIRPTVGTRALSGQTGTTSMSAFTVTIPPRGRVCVDNSVAVSVTMPECIGAAGRFVTGTVNSDGSAVTAITFSVDGGAPAAATFVPGVDPAYSFTIPAGLAAGNHTVTVTVTTADGRTASITQQVRVDNVPPTITCPENMDLYPASLIPGPVHYFAPTAADDCGSVSIICNPPSGSIFPFGITTVTCTAQDSAGNTTACTFTINVHRPCPPPVRSHRYSAAASTFFRYDDQPAWHSTTAMTIMAWVKRDSTDACETIISQDFMTSFWFGFCSSTGQIRFYRSGGSFADSTGTVVANQWTHVAVSYDGTTARFYIDGVAAGSSALTSSGTGTTDPISIGGDFTFGYGYGFSGLIDSLRIFPSALPAAMVASEMPEEFYNVSGQRFNSGGDTENNSLVLPSSISASPPQPEIEGMLPRYLMVPLVTGPNGVDGEVNPAGDYALADKMVIRYRGAAGGVQDAVAYFNYHDEPGDRALYIGVRHVRDVIAPWTRDKSWVALQVDPGGNTRSRADATDFRFNSRRLDGSAGPGFTPTGFERGLGSGNYGPLPPGDPLISAPTPFGLIGAGGDTVEFRLDLSTLGGNWDRKVRLGLSHHWISGIGVDANAPLSASYDLPASWSNVGFSGIIPELTLVPEPPFIWCSWFDPCLEFIAERSPNLQPTSWVPMTLYQREGMGSSPFDQSTSPRQFFRLRRR